MQLEKKYGPDALKLLLGEAKLGEPGSSLPLSQYKLRNDGIYIVNERRTHEATPDRKLELLVLAVPFSLAEGMAFDRDNHVLRAALAYGAGVDANVARIQAIDADVGELAHAVVHRLPTEEMERRVAWDYELVIDTLKAKPQDNSIAKLLLKVLSAALEDRTTPLRPTIEIDGRLFYVTEDLYAEVAALPDAAAKLLDITNPKVTNTSGPVAPSMERPEQGVTRRKLSDRANPLGAVFAQARANATDPNNSASVWDALLLIAKAPDRPRPLLGYVEGEGVKWESHDEKDPVKYLTHENFRDRWRRGTV